MDTLQFQPGWIDSDRDWMERQMRQFLSDHRDWVIDGNYSWCCYEERMEQADQIIFLNFSRWNCSLEPGNDTAVIKAASERVWRQAAPNALTGNSSVGSFGTVAKSDRSHAIGLPVQSTKPIRQNYSLSELKRAGCISKTI